MILHAILRDSLPQHCDHCAACAFVHTPLSAKKAKRAKAAEENQMLPHMLRASSGSERRAA